MNEEILEKPVKNQFQLELEAKMKERRTRGLTTALSPSPTELNQSGRYFSDDEDDILSSLQNNSFKSLLNYKSKGNSPDFNKRMQWGDSLSWNPGLLHKDDKVTNSLNITNRQSPSQKESPRSFENQKGYLKSTLKSPRNDAEIGSLQMVNSSRTFKDMPSKSTLKDSPRDGYKPERKTLSFSDHVEESSYSTASVIDQSLSSVGDAPTKSPSTSSGQRFLKSSKEKGKSVSIENNEERNNKVEVDPVRPVPSVRKKSLTSPPNVTNKDPDSTNSELSSARSRRHAFKTNTPSSVFQDNVDESFGKTSPSSTRDMEKPESPKASKHKRNSVSEQEKITSTYTLENKPSVDVPIREFKDTINRKSNEKFKDATNRRSENIRNEQSNDVTTTLQNNNDQELDEKAKKEKSAFIERQSYSNESTINIRDRTFSIDENSPQDISDDINTPFSRRRSLPMENNKASKNGDERDLNSTTRTMSPKSPSSVFDFLTKDFAEMKPAVQKKKSSENHEEFPPLAKNKEQSLDKDISSLFEEHLSESRPTPTPRKPKNQLLNKTGKPKKTTESLDENVEILDPNQLREKIFKEWQSQKNKLIKEKKKQKIQEEEKKKKELVTQRKDALVSFETWKKQKVPLLRQKLKSEMTKKESEIEKEREMREKRQKAVKLYELWKTEKDNFLKKEHTKKKEEEERKQKLSEQNKEKKQEENLKSFALWKKEKDKVLHQKKKDELKASQVVKEEQNYLNIQKESQSEESYQQWLWRKEEQEKEELKKQRELCHLDESYMIEPQQAWLPPSRTIPFGR